MKFPTLLLALLLAVTGRSVAQTRTISLRTLCFQHSGDLKEVMLVSGKKGSRKLLPVRLYTSAYSDEIEAKIEGGQILFAVPDEDPTEGAEPFRVIAQAMAAPGNRQLAVFFPVKDGKSPYKVQIIDESEQAFPMGSTLIYNLTQTSGRFSIGEHEKEIPSGKTGLLPLPTKVNQLNQCTVRIALLNPKKEWKMVSSTVWRASDQMRGLALAYIHPKTGKPTVNCFQETPPWRLPKLE